MREKFIEQLKTSTALTEERLSKLEGKSMYSKYQVGDKILYFILREQTDDNTVTISMKTVVEREIEKLEEEYNYSPENDYSFPVMVKK